MKFKKILLIILSSLAIASCGCNQNNAPTPTKTYDLSQYYDGYYENFSWKNGEELKGLLHEQLLRGYTAIPYVKSNVSNWESNQFADQCLYDEETVDVVYSASNLLKTDTYNNGSGWQREHAFAASLMTGLATGDAVTTLGRATDFHNLFASNNSGNGSRGNKNFGIADKNSETYYKTADYDNGDGYAYDNKNFEPGDKDKGRLARAIFYMVTMYNEDVTVGGKTQKALSLVEEYVDFNQDNYSAFAIGNKSTLVKWSKTFAVDYLEYQHNESVFSHQYKGVAQGNRNIYVDFPDLADYVFGSKQNKAGTLNKLRPSQDSLVKDMENIGLCFTIKNAKREYFVGETTSKDDYVVELRYRDLSTKKVEYQDNSTYYTFLESDIGRKVELTIAIECDPSLGIVTDYIYYTVSVTSGNLESCNYQHTLSAADITQGATSFSFTNIDRKLNNVDWNITSVNAIGVKNSGVGVQFGIATASASILTFTSKENFAFDNKNKVDKIYVKVKIASGKTYSLKIYVGTTCYLTTSIPYDSAGAKEFGITLTDSVTGPVKIEFSNVTAAIYVHSIGVNTID